MFALGPFTASGQWSVASVDTMRSRQMMRTVRERRRRRPSARCTGSRRRRRTSRQTRCEGGVSNLRIGLGRAFGREVQAITGVHVAFRRSPPSGGYAPTVHLKVDVRPSV